MIFKQEQPNIKRLTQETVQDTRQSFDATRDVNEEAWRGMVQAAYNDDTKLVEVAGFIALMDKQRARAFSQADWSEIIDELTRNVVGREAHGALEQACGIALLDRSRLKHFDPNIWIDISDGVVSGWGQWDEGDWRFGWVMEAAALSKLASLPCNFDFSEEQWEKILSAYRMRSMTQVPERLNFMASIKVVDPSRLPAITDEDWHTYRAWLRALQEKKEWYLFSDVAAKMQILAADRIEIDEKGVRLVDAPKVPNAAASAVPIRKRI